MGPRAERAQGGRDEEGRRGAANKDVPRDPPHLPVDFLAERMLTVPVTCGDTARSALQLSGSTAMKLHVSVRGCLMHFPNGLQALKILLFT
ncbi:hypothetical protein H8959_004509 [Pygathrix nigripes]